MCGCITSQFDENPNKIYNSQERTALFQYCFKSYFKPPKCLSEFIRTDNFFSYNVRFNFPYIGIQNNGVIIQEQEKKQFHSNFEQTAQKKTFTLITAKTLFRVKFSYRPIII